MPTRTWLITGARRGLGRAFTEAALAHGDRVVATARTADELAGELASYGDQALALTLDVNDRAAVHRTVDHAVEQVGQIDVVVNNAGYGLAGGVEEVGEAQARAQFDTNFFGPLWVTQAVLPHMRARRSGHIIQISSISAVKSGINLGIYCASKSALEGMSEALAREVAPFGIKVTIVEPSMFRTDWAGGSMVRATALDDYDGVLAERRQEYAEGTPSKAPGDPAQAARRLIEIVEMPDPPLRLLLGNKAVDIATAVYQGRLTGAAEWEAVSRSVDAPEGQDAAMTPAAP
jgi:NAD(P)-dependent dehydrogenase (short-subunit alcohol dehydrogenase family)